MGKTHRFEQVEENHLMHGAPQMRKYRARAMDIFRRANTRSYCCLFEELRGTGGLAFDEISFLSDLVRRVKHNEQVASVRGKDIRLALADILMALECTGPSITEISGITHPGPDMADWAIANGANRG